MGFSGNWEPGVQYNLDDVVEYEGHRYRIIQAHRSQSDWTPPVTPALWGRIPDQCRPVGEHQYGQHGEEQKQPPSYQNYQQQQQQVPAEQPKPEVAPTQGYTAPGGVNVEKQDAEKKWYDLDDSKKGALIGGGLALGLGLLGAGGYYAHEKHKEGKEEDQQAQAWELQNWIVASRQRTEEFFRNGPKGPVTWIFNEAVDQNPRIKEDLIPGGHDGQRGGEPWFIARAPHKGGIQLGKFKPGQGGAIIGYAHDAITVNQFEVLIGAKSAVRWLPAKGTLDAEELKGHMPVEGGREKDGTPLAIAKAEYKGSVIPGKASAKLHSAFITYEDDEEEVKEYEVLAYN